MRKFTRDRQVQWVSPSGDFNFFCFFFSWVWALWRGAWNVLWAYIGLNLAVFLITFSFTLMNPSSASGIRIAFGIAGFIGHCIICMNANALLASALEARGYRESP